MTIRVCREHNNVFLAPDIAPVTYVDSGDEIIFETYDCFSNKITEENQKSSLITEEFINPATGPVYINGAEKGDILKVEIIEIKIAESGLMAAIPGSGALKNVLKREVTKIFAIEKGKIKFNDNIVLDVDPMIGVIGTAPESSSISTDWPHDHGGNIDCKRIIAGSAVYLPVNVAGGLLSIGDLHALMGDGEIILCGLEVCGEVTVKVSVIKGKNMPTPCVVTKDKFLSISSAESLDQATENVIYNVHKFLESEIGMDPYEAGMLMSLKGDLSICQVVDPLMTVRLEIPKELLGTYINSI